MRCVAEIEQIIITPMVVEAQNEPEALELAVQLLQQLAVIHPEELGDPVVEPPRIRSVRMMGD